MAEPKWHPILAAREGPTGTWHMVDALDHVYGTIEIRRVMNGAEVRYRCSFRGEVIGWATTLLDATERVHRAFIAAHGPAPFAGYPQFDSHKREPSSVSSE